MTDSGALSKRFLISDSDFVAFTKEMIRDDEALTMAKGSMMLLSMLPFLAKVGSGLSSGNNPGLNRETNSVRSNS